MSVLMRYPFLRSLREFFSVPTEEDSLPVDTQLELVAFQFKLLLLNKDEATLLSTNPARRGDSSHFLKTVGNSDEPFPELLRLYGEGRLGHKAMELVFPVVFDWINGVNEQVAQFCVSDAKSGELTSIHIDREVFARCVLTVQPIYQEVPA